MRCDSIPIRIETKRIEYLLPLLASRLKNLLLSKFYPERFNSLAGCLRGAAMLVHRHRQRQGVDSESSWRAENSPHLRLPTIHLVASEFLTQRFHFIFLGKFLACSARWHCMKFAQSPVGCSLFFSTFHIQLPLSFTPLCGLPPVPLLLLLLLSILLLFTLHWPLYCICFQFQLLRTVSPSDSASSLPFSCALPCSTIATWRIRNQPIPDLQLQFHFNTLGQINAMVNARYARIQEGKLMFTKDISQVKGSIVLFSWIIFIL